MSLFKDERGWISPDDDLDAPFSGDEYDVPLSADDLDLLALRDEILFTVGHSNHSEETFLGLLAAHGIGVLVDVRLQPRSRWPHFTQGALQRSLGRVGIEYIWMEALGNPAAAREARGADFKELLGTPRIRAALQELRELVQRSAARVCIMCAEETWLASSKMPGSVLGFGKGGSGCHRWYIARDAYQHGIEVVNLLGDGRAELFAQSRGSPIGSYFARPRPEAIAPTCPPSTPSPAPKQVKMAEHRVVLHVDCDEFFLQVHEMMDPSMRSTIRGQACALWQFNDVISMNCAARACGVKKHMTPREARALLAPVRGHLIHAFWRRWPGPRVNYKPYQHASLLLFRTLQSLLRSLAAPSGAATTAAPSVMERTSIDECYIDVTGFCGGSLALGARLAEQVQEHVQHRAGVRVSVGCARNKLLAKLASQACKSPVRASSSSACAPHRPHRILVVGDAAGEADAASFLETVAATRVPGLGGKEAQLLAMGVRVASELRRFSEGELAARLALSAHHAADVWRACRGEDHAPVVAANPPKSLGASSWAPGVPLADLALRRHTGRGGAAVRVGSGWVFEPHETESKSNGTRGRWILLAMALDLADKIHAAWLEFAVLPTKLSVGWREVLGTTHAGIAQHEGVPGRDSGATHSKTVPLPPKVQQAFEAPASATNSPLPAREVTPQRPLPDSASGVGISPLRSVLIDGPEIMEDKGYREMVAGLVDTAAGALHLVLQEDTDKHAPPRSAVQ
eukprot:gene17946-21375_t